MPNDFNLKEESEFIQASAAGDISLLSTLFEKDPALVNTPALNGSYPLMFAAEAGKAEAVGWLIAKGSTIDAENEIGITALWYAAYNKHWDIAQMLLQAGAKKIDATLEEGRYKGLTALWFAAAKDQWDMVRKLLQAGA